jgi:DNA repair protein RecN (Recombination protein N)
VVGRLLATLARDHQVLVVTHLAQVAAFADKHFVVEKQQQDGRTTTQVRQLDSDERERELARMLSGSVSDTARAHARELLAERDTLPPAPS